MSASEELSRDELIELVGERDAQIATMAGTMAELLQANEVLAARVATLEHLLSRNSKNSSSPPSQDGDPGRAPSPEKAKGGAGGVKRKKGNQPGAPGANLAWTDSPDDQQERFPEGTCECGTDLAGACDLGVVDRYQQHEIPQISVRITQYEQHSVRCGCGRVHTATRPQGARPGAVGYGPTLQSLRCI